MTTIKWDSSARSALRKLPSQTAQRIYRKVDRGIVPNVPRHLERLAGGRWKIRIGDYRLFVDWDASANCLTVLTLRHRRVAYKR